VGPGGAAPVPWEVSLPSVSTEEVDWRGRAAPLAARLDERARRLGDPLGAALGEIWPFGSAAPGTLVRLAVEGREVVLDRFPAVVGSAERSDLRLEGEGVAGEHARLEGEAGLAALVDLRSPAGTRLNGEPLSPLVRALLRAGDRVEIGGRALHVTTVEEVPPGAARVAVRAAGWRLRREDPLAGSAPSDRWVEVRWAGEAVFVRVSAPWMRALWTPLDEPEPSAAGEPGPLEEGAAQFALSRVAQRLAESLGEPVDLAAWLRPEQVAAAAGFPAGWLDGEAWIAAAGVTAATRLLVPVAGDARVRRALPPDVVFPARVCLGWVRLRAREWADVEPGDALLPDVWWPGDPGTGGAADGSAGAYLRVGDFWCAGALSAAGGGATFRIAHPWFRSAGGEWLVADENPVPGSPPLELDDLEVQIAVELDRFPASLAELQGWCVGAVLTLRQAPGDPVRLVMETGLQRRVLAEGRVVVVDGRLGIEVLRILGAPSPPSRS
jgi:flagellar motor switch/type III secretory pathway protein FliN/pSer/pThr/pTyr-binding forkhead associated (FHA) protein